VKKEVGTPPYFTHVKKEPGVTPGSLARVKEPGELAPPSSKQALCLTEDTIVQLEY
jgi:hypothetical protein